MIKRFSVAFSSFVQKTHYTLDINSTLVHTNVALNGWLEKPRKISSSLYFAPLRDSRGTVQIVVSDPSHISTLNEITPESIVSVQGKVRERPVDTINTLMKTGRYEILVNKLDLINPAKSPLPFSLKDKKQTIANEDVRLKYRYLDLRRPFLHHNVQMRSNASHLIRCYLHKQGFTEVETPLLFKSTPEGAKEFLVPTRDGLYYALPQSPQQHKQILMASGVDKYFQMARCFRDEGQKADRQSEFTQVDMEMSFVKFEDIYEIVEGLVRLVWKELVGKEIGKFDRMTYKSAMEVYGVDKPDRRFDMKLHCIGEFNERMVDAFVVEKGGILSDAELRKVVQECRGVKYYENDCISVFRLSQMDGLLKSIGKSALDQLKSKFIMSDTDLIAVCKRKKQVVGSATPLGKARVALATLLESKNILKMTDADDFLWVHSFPLFMPSENGGGWEATHHPFTAPKHDHIEYLETKEYEKIQGQHYDLVLNGVEVGGGSIRIHSPKLQLRIFEILGLSDIQKQSFSHLIDALGYGCPPHGGIALGFDRLLSIICKTDSIKDVIAFPKSTCGVDLMVNAPSKLSKEALDEYYGKAIQ